MHKRFDGARRILLSRAHTLEGIAAEVGLTAAELFDGVMFDGIDLTDEPINLLVKIDADYSGAILTRQQNSALRNTPIQRRKSRRKILDIRASLVRKFINDNFDDQHRARINLRLVEPLFSQPQERVDRMIVSGRYTATMIQLSASEQSHLTNSIETTVINLLLTIRKARLPISEDFLKELPDEGATSRVIYDVEKFETLVDLNLCTQGFMRMWLDYFDAVGGHPDWPKLDGLRDISRFRLERPRNVANATSMGDEDRQSALSFAIRAPDRPPASYVEDVLGRARSGEELRDLVAVLPTTSVDKDVASVAARLLARGATNNRSVSATLSDDRINNRISGAFRRLLVLADNPQSRRALIEAISEMGERASGLEVDAVVASLSFNETASFLRPYWNRLTSHHQNIARAALLEKATSSNERSQARMF